MYQTVLIFQIYIYYSQKELKHFGLGTLVIHGILKDIDLNIFKLYFGTNVPKSELFTKMFELYEVLQIF